MPGAKRDTVRTARDRWSRSGRIGSPTTTVVEPAAVCHFVDTHGSGEPAAVWVAAQQLELIAAQQLRAAGVGRSVIRTRRRQGTLHLVHTGVYHVGTNVMLPGAAELAAVLACGDGGVPAAALGGGAVRAHRWIGR